MSQDFPSIPNYLSVTVSFGWSPFVAKCNLECILLSEKVPEKNHDYHSVKGGALGEKEYSQIHLLCPRCGDIAIAIAIDSYGEVILWGCLNCYHQGVSDDFINVA